MAFLLYLAFSFIFFLFSFELGLDISCHQTHLSLFFNILSVLGLYNFIVVVLPLPAFPVVSLHSQLIYLAFVFQPAFQFFQALMSPKSSLPHIDINYVLPSYNSFIRFLLQSACSLSLSPKRINKIQAVTSACPLPHKSEIAENTFL